MDKSILLILTNGDCGNAIHEALRYAQSTSKQLHVIQILTSDLYHYGRQDLVATRPSKREFLIYFRDEVLKRGQEQVRVLEEAARKAEVSLEIQTMESENVPGTALSEVKKGYDAVFLPKEKKKLFPLFEKTLAVYLQKKASGKIIAC